MTKATLTNIQRREICLKNRIIQKDFVEWCKQTLKVKIDQATVSRLLKQSSEFLDIHVDELHKPFQKRAQTVKFPELEKALLEWCLRAQGQIPLTDQLLVEKARSLRCNYIFKRLAFVSLKKDII